jgi:hypothetical protein
VAGCSPRRPVHGAVPAGCNPPRHLRAVAGCSPRRPVHAAVPAGCNPARRFRAVAGCSPRRPVHAAVPGGCNPARRLRAVAGCGPRRPVHAAVPAGCNPRCPVRGVVSAGCNPPRRLRAVAGCSPRRRAVVPADCNPRRRLRAADSVGCSPRRPARVAVPAGRKPRRPARSADADDRNRRRRRLHDAALAARSLSRPVHAEARPYGSRSSPGLPGPYPPQAAVVARWSGDPPRRRPHCPPKRAEALPDAHSPSCRLSGPRPCPGPAGNLSIPRYPKSAAAGTAAPRFPDARPGPRPPHFPARTLTPLLRDRKGAGTDKTALRSSRCPDCAEAGKAAHRPPHCQGQSHRPGPARHQNRHVAHRHARRPDAQRYRPDAQRYRLHAHHQASQHRRHADPPKQPDPALPLYPGRQSSGRNHVPPNPLHAARTPLPPRLPPPLPSGQIRTPQTVGRWVTWARSSVRVQVICRTAATPG